MTTATDPDPRVQAANIQAAVLWIAEAALALEFIEAQISDLLQEPPTAARLARLFALRFKRSSAERQQRHAIHHGYRAGLGSGREYPADLDGLSCFVFIDGPTVTVFTE